MLESARDCHKVRGYAKMADSLIQHVFSGDRMQAFSDAVFAIMATMLVRQRILCACVRVCTINVN